jgi:SAM-dependent methyltransferase
MTHPDWATQPPLNIREATANYRSPDPADYPELAGYTCEQVYEETLGGGGLYLAVKMLRTMDLQPGDIVLDLGCGKGTTSLYLAQRFGVQVVAVDLWTSAAALNERIVAKGFRDRIVPLNMDIAQPLPFAEGYFDHIFCMNSFNFYGGSVKFLQHLLTHLKPGGLLCVGMETLSEEFSGEGRRNPPAVYNYNLPPPNEHINTWEADFSKMHSPPWWQDLFTSSGLLEVLYCRELDDAVILYEDLVLHQIQHDLDPADVAISIAQLDFGRHHRPYKTLFIITARKL